MTKGWQELKLMHEHLGKDVVVKFLNNLMSKDVPFSSFYSSYEKGEDNILHVWAGIVTWDLGSHIRYGFDWESSPEGFCYWLDVRNKIIGL